MNVLIILIIAFFIKKSKLNPAGGLGICALRSHDAG